MADPVVEKWDKNNCNDTVYKIELIEKLNALIPSERQKVLLLLLVWFMRFQVSQKKLQDF